MENVRNEVILLQPKQSTVMMEILDWGKSIMIALVIVLILNHFVFNLSTVEGQSMEPTLQEKEWLFINRAVYIFGHPQRGDIVILKDPHKYRGRNVYLVKRVVGIPGDEVEVRAGRLYVNGEEVEEPYVNGEIQDQDMPPMLVGEGEYFVLGDNRHRGASMDSRFFGTVSEQLIKGRADFVLWPLSKIGGL